MESQVKAVRPQEKLGKQNFREEMKKVIEPVTKSYKDVCEEATQTITEASNNNNKALENLNNKILEILNDRNIFASYLMFPLYKITNPENSTQLNLLKDHNSNIVNDLLIKKTMIIILHDNLLTFRDTGKVFDLKGDLLKMITNKNYNVDLASLTDKIIMSEFAKETIFDIIYEGIKSTRGRTHKIT